MVARPSPALKRRTVRSARADLFALPWNTAELVDMDLDDAREILFRENDAHEQGKLGVETEETLSHAQAIALAAET